MDLREGKGLLFDYKDQYSALIMLGMMSNEDCKAELTEQARLFKSMNDLLPKFEEGIPCADQFGRGYFFYVPFDAEKAEDAKTTLREAFMIMRECGADSMCVKVCGTDAERLIIKEFLLEYDKEHSLGDVMLLG